MSEAPKTIKPLYPRLNFSNGGQYIGGVVSGIAIGYILTSLLHRDFPTAEANIGSALSLLSFALFCGGALYARFTRRR